MIHHGLSAAFASGFLILTNLSGHNTPREQISDLKKSYLITALNISRFFPAVQLRFSLHQTCDSAEKEEAGDLSPASSFQSSFPSRSSVVMAQQQVSSTLIMLSSRPPGFTISLS